MVRRKLIQTRSLFYGALFLSLTAHASPVAAATVDASYLYTLSDFTGPIPYGGGTIFVDKQRNEAYVLYQSIVTVFNSSGLEVYRFGDNKNLGQIRDLAVEQDGSILLLSYNDMGDRFEVIRCNFQGDPKSKIALTGLPAVFKDFQPNHLAYRDGHIYLADNGNLQVVIMDGKGNVKQSLDLFTLLDLEENQRNNILMDGFSVDREGSVLFTLPVLFSAFRVSLGGNVASFGKPGSLPGKFGVVSGIIADNRGNYLVADKLRTVISVFDNDFNFLTEFGFRGNAPGNLIGPMDLAIDGNDSVYVVQAGNKGVSVFKMHYAEQRISAGKGVAPDNKQEIETKRKQQ
jgi:hypothetical protein